MKKLWRILGRLMIVALLLSSAVLKLKSPNSFQSSFKTGYTKVKTLFPFLNGFPPTDYFTPYLNKIIVVAGILEGITALFIFCGDHIGGLLFASILVIMQICTNGHTLSQIVKMENPMKILQMGTFFCLLGVALILCDTAYVRRKAK